MGDGDPRTDERGTGADGGPARIAHGAVAKVQPGEGVLAQGEAAGQFQPVEQAASGAFVLLRRGGGGKDNGGLQDRAAFAA
ncbi:hypothetical protein [Novosphingobium sp. MBES04]|uniref:hypothetical protein n=1 Tax=Novosphingobium sp. MBES04 TaxID=1206458 RepID=UPI00057D469F|nr:hypothetical protein [Novosphingobium sp. MBES04]GAM03489.1 hypothetical protein MBENS4_0488 [Novosphingobium sp. MBES04]